MVQKHSKSRALAHFLKDSRVAAGFSQMEISKLLGYSTSQFISNWERGQSAPPLEVVKELAKHYGVSADTLFDLCLDCSVERVKLRMTQRFYGKKSI